MTFSTHVARYDSTAGVLVSYRNTKWSCDVSSAVSTVHDGYLKLKGCIYRAKRGGGTGGAIRYYRSFLPRSPLLGLCGQAKKSVICCGRLQLWMYWTLRGRLSAAGCCGTENTNEWTRSAMANLRCGNCEMQLCIQIFIFRWHHTVYMHIRKPPQRTECLWWNVQNKMFLYVFGWFGALQNTLRN